MPLAYATRRAAVNAALHPSSRVPRIRCEEELTSALRELLVGTPAVLSLGPTAARAIPA